MPYVALISLLKAVFCCFAAREHEQQPWPSRVALTSGEAQFEKRGVPASLSCQLFRFNIISNSKDKALFVFFCVLSFWVRIMRGAFTSHYIIIFWLRGKAVYYQKYSWTSPFSVFNILLKSFNRSQNIFYILSRYKFTVK